ncbi:hypothetical protein Naga_104402g1 [Nannochloropsis gaditana]|uniref:Uncharacterized protein n=1 Tax=Nannochloropsis gaditana TaxID=72520 RepID=W7TT48_9STRA|nr:hypothetical protein Naga_104402g1 [Nannochloropsis gaditana]
MLRNSSSPPTLSLVYPPSLPPARPSSFSQVRVDSCRFLAIFLGYSHWIFPRNPCLRLQRVGREGGRE